MRHHSSAALAKVTGLARLGGMLLCTAAPGQDPSPAAATKLDAGVPEGTTTAAVFVRMKGQLLPNGKAFIEFCARHRGDPRRKLRPEIIGKLKASADRSFAEIEKTVQGLGGDIIGLKRYWIVNGFACQATGEACRALAACDAVEFIYAKPDRVPPLHARPRSPGPTPRPGSQITASLVKRALAARTRSEAKMQAMLASTADDPGGGIAGWQPTFNLERIGAVAAWRKGAMGHGIVIAMLDSGLLPTEALLGALWHNPKEEFNGKDDDGNGYVDDLFGYDFQNDTGISIGDNRAPSHGSMCGGILAGRPVEVDGKQLVTGVAPRAQLMVLRGMGLIESYQYALDQGADVVSMSYMWVGIELGNWRGLYRLAHEHMMAAGIVSVGGSGNFGGASRRAAGPGKQICLPKDIPCVIAASGLDKSDELPGFSSLGPCTWNGVRFYDDYPPQQPLVKPDVTAYSTGFPCWTNINRQLVRRTRWTVVHDAGDDIGLATGPQGNSFAGPHAGGVAALMLSANPDLPAWRVKEIMEATCKDLGEKGRDVKFGAGMIDAAAAVAAAMAAAPK